MMLKIGEFSRSGPLSVKALRHYEAVGLLKPARLDGAIAYRYYDAAQFDDLHRLMALHALGLPLERIRQVLQDDPSPEQMRRPLDDRRAAIARRIDAEQAQFAAVEARIRHLEGNRDTSPEVALRDAPPVFVASLRRVLPDSARSMRCSTRSRAPCRAPRAAPATVRSGITARRSAGKSIAKP
jgi:DNA-binding transcriptional MerR regulator